MLVYSFTEMGAGTGVLGICEEMFVADLVGRGPQGHFFDGSNQSDLYEFFTAEY